MKQLLITFCCILLSGSSFAKTSFKSRDLAKNSSKGDRASSDEDGDDDAPKAKRTFSGKKIVKLEEDEIAEDSSEFHRQNKKLSLTLEIIGFTPTATGGAAIGYYLNPDNIIEIGNVQGSSSFLGDSSKISTNFLRIKSFMGNSFYTNLGVAHRKIQTSYSYYNFDLNTGFSRSDASIDTSSESIAVEFGIGNRWQWDTFTIGCDWVGIIHPISVLKQTSEAKGVFLPEEVSDAMNSTESYTKRTTGQLLRFYLGVSF